MNRSTFRIIKYMYGSVFSKAMYMNGVGFEILARTPVSQLPPLSYTPTPSTPSSVHRIWTGNGPSENGPKIADRPQQAKMTLIITNVISLCI